MDYEKKYNEALERARKYMEKGYDVLMPEIFPELAESEDERIRKELFDFIYDGIWHDAIIEKVKQTQRYIPWLNYLEKQKKPVVGKEGMYYYLGGEFIYCGYPATKENPYDFAMSQQEKQKEQKQELVYRLNGLMQDYIKEGKDDEEKEHRFKCYQLFWDALEDTNFFEQKEQKPTEWSEEDYHWEGLVQLLRDYQKTIDRNSNNMTYEDVECYICWVNSLRPQPKQQWSEEDNIGWDEAFACVTRAEKAAKNEEELQNAVTAEKWLKEIKFKYYVHPVKQEWSEEDEKNLELVIDCIYEFYPDPVMKYALKDWLKSIRPSWKPSEEQMDSLRNTIIQTKGYSYSMYLPDLYEHLKGIYNNGKD